MKCVITGHTTGLGKAMYEAFKAAEWEVIGVSRQTGYDLNTDISRVVDLVNGADLFINNANVNRAQFNLLNAVNKNVKQIVLGSVAGEFNQQLQSDYSQHKADLAQRCRELSLLPDTKILHIQISMLEDAVNGDVLIKYQEVLDVIDFWMTNPRFTNISFEFKLTPFTLERAKVAFNISPDNLNRIVSKMCEETKSGL
jgi:glycosyltransferase involved in cell wall biosynthesis